MGRNAAWPRDGADAAGGFPVMTFGGGATVSPRLSCWANRVTAYIGPPDDCRAVWTGSEAVRWTIPPFDDTWHGAPTITDNRVFAASGRLYKIDTKSGEML